MESKDIVEAIDGLAHAIHLGLSNLGKGNAATPMGALEAHGQAILEAAETIAGAISQLSLSIDHFER
jgi:hypothetical protein